VLLLRNSQFHSDGRYSVSADDIIIFVKFFEIALINLNSLRWELLIMPGSILLLSISLKFFELKEK